MQQTKHQQRIEKYMRYAGQDIPETPTIPSPEVRVLRANLILEEALETITKGLGVEVRVLGGVVTPAEGLPVTEEALSLKVNPLKDPDLEEIADGCADISVVTIGTLSACGIKDKPLLQEVDAANLRKFPDGKPYKIREDGKFLKPPDWQGPDILGALIAQGWESKLP